MPGDPWLKSFRRSGLLLLASGLIGLMFEPITRIVLLIVLGCLAWNLFHLHRLEHWLRKGNPWRPPNTNPLPPGSMWREVYAGFYRLRQRSRKRKRKVSRILKQFQSAAAALPDAVVVLDEDDRVQWCNDASQRLLGLQTRQDSGLQIGTLVRHPRFVQFLLQRRYEENVEFPSPAQPETILNVRIAPYGKKQRLLLATDITRIHRLEQMRQDFVANVSHELRTPLTVIAGYLETLLDSLDGEDPSIQRWQQPLRGMHQQSRRMLRIVEDLLMLARLESHGERPMALRPVDVPALLAAIVEDAIALSGERGHEIFLEANRNGWIRGCESSLRSAFSNLVFNAVRYTPDQGHIDIRWFVDEYGVHLEVEDDGEGIPPQHLHRITERFYRINRDRSRERGGTGLGLAIVKHVLKNHGAKLRITSEVGVGSIFSCDFPAALQVRPALPPVAKAPIEP